MKIDGGDLLQARVSLFMPSYIQLGVENLSTHRAGEMLKQ